MRLERAFDPPRDLTIPLPGSTTLRDLASRSLARLMHETPALLVEAAREAGTSGFREWARSLTGEPGVTLSLLRRPHLGGLARVLRHTSEPGERRPLLVELLATLACEVSLAARPAATLSLESLPPRILALGANRVLTVPREATGATFSPASVEIRGGPASLRPATVDVDEPIRLALFDNNPICMNEAHPEKSGNALDLGGHTVEAWAASLREALSLVAEFAPELRAEMDQGVELVVPVGFRADTHVSASYAEVPGTLYLSLHPDPVTMAIALLHEFSHTKLNLLSEHDPILENAHEPLFPSPIRPDRRPLWGVLLALHAFLPVELFLARMRSSAHRQASGASWIDRAREIREGNEEALATLSQHGRLTPVGDALLDELTRLSERLRLGG
jgi:HEXXH motif-containing protein